ncbi:MAG: branched-chain amino acid aminotransferase, partial [Actinobacteria bacterium]|nr:branched-chain amino acid aminotransferase [Actinomycetota bacterium]
MTETIHPNLDVSAAAVAASGVPVYPTTDRSSSVAQVVVHPNPNPVSDESRSEILANPGFGNYFTDNIVRATWTSESGWQQSELVASDASAGGFSLNALHYGQSIFEGLKAYRHADGGIYLFRPEANALRFQRSAARLALPPLPTDIFIGAIEALVRQDQAWVPADAEKSLYLRPLEFGSEAALGVRPATHVTYVLLASPVGAYFPQGVKPVSVWISDDYVRAAPGGTGEAKCAGNYAASLVAQAEATAQGCDQVVWLDALERKYIEEMGGMNLFFVYGTGSAARLVTPKLTGTLLPGVTRDSLLTLAGDLGLPASEETISVSQWREDCASGEITEVFACGTAAVITPVGKVASK